MENDKTERAGGLGRKKTSQDWENGPWRMTRQKEQEDLAEKKSEGTGKGNQMTALRFQTGGDIRHPRPSRDRW